MNIFEEYRALSNTHQLGIAATLFAVSLLLLPSAIAFALAAIAAYKLIDERPWKYVTVSALAILAFFAGILWIADDTSPAVVDNPVVQKQENVRGSEQVTNKATSTGRGVVSSGAVVENEQERVPSEVSVITENVPSPGEMQAQNSAHDTYDVVDVVDGDTVKLNINGIVETARLIGIDTPETVHPSKPVECFGIEASNKAKTTLSGRAVSFETDPSQGTRDTYGRLLGYIILSDGSNFNQMMIEQGYAYEYTYSVPYKYQSAFKAAEQNARTSGAGLWAEGVCDEEQDPATGTTLTSGKWYVSSHHSSEYYYCEESDGWKSLSEKYLEAYDSEEALRAVYPSHTLHESCQ